jgi:methyl-accepting chemotaxis protein
VGHAGSRETSAGTDQIGRAIQQLDRATRQNAAGAEELAATSREPSDQAPRLVGSIAFFTIGGGETRGAPALPALPYVAGTPSKSAAQSSSLAPASSATA